MEAPLLGAQETKESHFTTQIQGCDRFILIAAEKENLETISTKIIQNHNLAKKEFKELKSKTQDQCDILAIETIKLEALKDKPNPEDRVNSQFTDIKILTVKVDRQKTDLADKTKEVDELVQSCERQQELLENIKSNSAKIDHLAKAIRENQASIDDLKGRVTDLRKKKERHEKGLQISGICAGTFSSATGLTGLGIGCAQIFGAGLATTLTGGIAAVATVVTSLTAYACARLIVRRKALSGIAETDASPLILRSFSMDQQTTDHKTWTDLANTIASIFPEKSQELKAKFKRILSAECNEIYKHYQKVYEASNEALKNYKTEEDKLTEELKNTDALQTSLWIFGSLSKKIASTDVEKEKKE